MSSSVHVDNKNKNIFILGEGPTVLRIRRYYINYREKYSINFTESRKKFCLSLHYNGANSYYSLMELKFKAKDSEISAILLCLGSVSKDFSVDNMKKTGLNGYVYDFSVNYDAIAVDDILDTHKYLMKKHGIV